MTSSKIIHLSLLFIFVSAATNPDKVNVVVISNIMVIDPAFIPSIEEDGMFTVTTLLKEEITSKAVLDNYDVLFLSTDGAEISENLANIIESYVIAGRGIVISGQAHLSLAPHKLILQKIFPVLMEENGTVCPIAGLGSTQEEKIPVYMKIDSTQDHEITRNIRYTAGSSPLSLYLTSGLVTDAKSLGYFYNDVQTPCNPPMPSTSDVPTNIAKQALAVLEPAGERKGRSVFLAFPMGVLYTYVGSQMEFLRHSFFSLIIHNSIAWAANKCDDDFCKNDGICKGKNKCRCPTGWEGDSCTVPVCEFCSTTYGTCTAPNVCVCHDTNRDDTVGCIMCKIDFIEKEENGVETCVAISSKDLKLHLFTASGDCTYDDTTGTVTANSGTCTLTYSGGSPALSLSSANKRRSVARFYADSITGTASVAVKMTQEGIDKDSEPVVLNSEQKVISLEYPSGTYAITITITTNELFTMTMHTNSIEVLYCKNAGGDPALCSVNGTCVIADIEHAKCNCDKGWEQTLCDKPKCGDKLIRGDEECDFGTTTMYGCYDCKIESGWTCDDNECTPEKCGDGILAKTAFGDDLSPEVCDDGNNVNGDGCSSNCKKETGYECVEVKMGNDIRSECKPMCGDGLIVGNEECDPCDKVAKPGCNECTEVDGYICTSKVSDTDPKFKCTVSCESSCGNGRLNEAAGEKCDLGKDEKGDSRNIDGNGCDENCKVVEGWICDNPNGTRSPSVCVPICGDELIVGHEECDDGNVLSGDGCSSDCRIERGYNCEYKDYEGSKKKSFCTLGSCTVSAEQHVTQPTCNDGSAAAFGSLQVTATTTTDVVSSLHYTLIRDGESVKEATTGVFAMLDPEHEYYVRVVSQPVGCSKETEKVNFAALPDKLDATATKTDLTDCAGADGTISIEVTSGEEPFKLTLGGSESKAMTGKKMTVTGLGAGVYRVGLSDKNNCFVSLPVLTIQYPTKCMESQFENMWARGGKEGLVIIIIGVVLLFGSMIVAALISRAKMIRQRKRYLESIASTPDTDLKAQYNIAQKRTTADV